MGLALVQSRALLGLAAPRVTVEVHLANGLPSFTLVGLADVEVKEARERVRSALLNSGLEFPSNKRIIVNLAPADLPKDSGRFDLPIALGILAASGQINGDAWPTTFAGELRCRARCGPCAARWPRPGPAPPAGQRPLVLPPGSAVASCHRPRCSAPPPAGRGTAIAIDRTLVTEQEPAVRGTGEDTEERFDAAGAGAPAPARRRGAAWPPSPCAAAWTWPRCAARHRRGARWKSRRGHGLLLVGPPDEPSMLAQRCRPASP